MTSHMQGDYHLFEQTLNDAIALCTAVEEFDRRMANECPPDLKPKLEKMAQDDHYHLENFRKVLKNFGWQETKPSDFATKLIDCCRQFMNSNEPFLRKFGAYNVLNAKLAGDAMMLATACYTSGDRECEQLMGLNVTESLMHRITLGGHALDMMTVMAKGLKGKKAA